MARENCFKKGRKSFVNLEGNVDYHKELSSFAAIHVPLFYPVQELSFKNKTVVYFQGNWGGDYVVVPGFKNSKEYKDKRGNFVADVLTIVDKKDKKEISDLLNDKVGGPIDFW